MMSSINNFRRAKNVPPKPTDKVFCVNEDGKIIETPLTWGDLERIALHEAIQRGPLPPMPEKDWQEWIDELKQRCNYDPDDFKGGGDDSGR
jgi:hypothetical protein